MFYGWLLRGEDEPSLATLVVVGAWKGYCGMGAGNAERNHI